MEGQLSKVIARLPNRILESLFMDKAAPWGPHLLLDSLHLALVEVPSPFHAAHMTIPSSREDPGGPSGFISHSPALAFSSLFICGSWEFIQHFYVIRGRRRTFHVESVHHIFFSAELLLEYSTFTYPAYQLDILAHLELEVNSEPQGFSHGLLSRLVLDVM